MSGKTNTIGRRPKRGTVTKASARGVKVSKAKTPRPDKRTTAGRKRQAKQSKRDRVARASARPVDVDTRRELSATEQARMEHLVAALRATHDKAMRLLGVDGDAPERPHPGPQPRERDPSKKPRRGLGFVEFHRESSPRLLRRVSRGTSL